jgi:hypothetical protein
MKEELFKLNRDEATCLYWKAKNYQVTEVANKVFHKSHSTVTKIYTSAYRKLGLETTSGKSPEGLEPYLNEIVDIVGDLDWPSKIERWPPRQESPRSQLQLILFLIVVVITLVWLFITFQERITEFLSPPPVVVTVIVTPEPIITEPPAEVQETVPPVVVPPVTDEPTDVVPTATFTPFPVGVAVDVDFTDGMPEDWNVTRGNVSVVNGQLVALENSHIYLGNRDWVNYSVEFDVIDSPRFFSHVGVRTQNPENYISLAFSSGQTRWYINSNGEDEIPNTRIDISLVGSRLKVEVEGNEYRSFVGNVPISSIVDSKFDKGLVLLRLYNTTIIDNFTITLLP